MFDSLFHQFYSPLVNYCKVILKDEVLAEDLVQELFIQIWNKGNYNDIADIKSYIFKSAKNKCMDHLRKKRVTELYPDVSLISNQTHQENSDLKEEDIEATFIYMLSFLSPKERDVFVMNRIDGLTYREISETKNIPIKTIESQISKALKTLREISKKILQFIFPIYLTIHIF